MFASRGKQRVRRSSNFELYAWYFMRISGLILLVIAVFHVLYMHINVGVGNIDFDDVSARWDSPFWRIFELFLLVFGLSHGINGTRQILDDYVHSRGWRVVARTTIYMVGLAIGVMGAYVLFTFEAPV
jgi:succinate dehydrogenase / fumarate reductase membrane anchor subunit